MAVSGDFLLTAFTRIDIEDPKRQYLALDLNTATVDGNYDLVSPHTGWVLFPVLAKHSVLCRGIDSSLVILLVTWNHHAWGASTAC